MPRPEKPPKVLYVCPDPYLEDKELGRQYLAESQLGSATCPCGGCRYEDGDRCRPFRYRREDSASKQD